MKPGRLKTLYMNKWVCNTKNFGHFTYGKTYEGEVFGSLLDVKDDIGQNPMPCLYGTELSISTIPTKRIYYFITLEEWRDKQLTEIINE